MSENMRSENMRSEARSAMTGEILDPFAARQAACIGYDAQAFAGLPTYRVAVAPEHRQRSGARCPGSKRPVGGNVEIGARAPCSWCGEPFRTEASGGMTIPESDNHSAVPRDPFSALQAATIEYDAAAFAATDVPYTVKINGEWHSDHATLAEAKREVSTRRSGKITIEAWGEVIWSRTATKEYDAAAFADDAEIHHWRITWFPDRALRPEQDVVSAESKEEAKIRFLRRRPNARDIRAITDLGPI